MKVEIKGELVDYIESLQYETYARKDIIAFMLEKNMNMSTDSAKEYQKEYKRYFSEYEIALQQLKELYIYANPSIADKEVKWSLDFESKMLTIEVDNV